MPPPDAGEGVSGALLSEALSYRRRGWAVVPVQSGGKKPAQPGRCARAKLARSASKRGLLAPVWRSARQCRGDPGRGVWRACRRRSRRPRRNCAVGWFPSLPKTEAAFGRAGKQRSHWLYCALELKPRQFKDPGDGAMLLELRGTGMQTVFPPVGTRVARPLSGPHAGIRS